MIGKLRGIVDNTSEDSIIIDVNGVGYVVFCSGNTLRKLPGKGETTSLLIDTRIGEDRFDLLGFLEESERQWYRELVKINGVSARIALAVLSVLTPAQLSNAIMAQDNAAFKQASGVGAKLATRIVTEMKDRAPGLTTESINLPEHSNNIATSANTESPSIGDAVSALVNLGYNRTDAFTAISKAAAGNELPVGELIRLGLKQLSKELA